MLTCINFQAAAEDLKAEEVLKSCLRKVTIIVIVLVIFSHCYYYLQQQQHQQQ